MDLEILGWKKKPDTPQESERGIAGVSGNVGIRIRKWNGEIEG